MRALLHHCPAISDKRFARHSSSHLAPAPVPSIMQGNGKGSICQPATCEAEPQPDHGRWGVESDGANGQRPGNGNSHCATDGAVAKTLCESGYELRWEPPPQGHADHANNQVGGFVTVPLFRAPRNVWRARTYVYTHVHIPAAHTHRALLQTCRGPMQGTLARWVPAAPTCVAVAAREYTTACWCLYLCTSTPVCCVNARRCRAHTPCTAWCFSYRRARCVSVQPRVTWMCSTPSSTARSS